MSPERRARVEARVQAALKEMPLHELRRAHDLTQVTLAKVMETSQGEVSKIEQRTDVYLSTLRHYLQAMGASPSTSSITRARTPPDSSRP